MTVKKTFMYACICEKLKLKIKNSQQNGTYGRIRIRKVSKHILDTINKYIIFYMQKLTSGEIVHL